MGDIMRELIEYVNSLTHYKIKKYEIDEENRQVKLSLNLLGFSSDNFPIKVSDEKVDIDIEFSKNHIYNEHDFFKIMIWAISLQEETKELYPIEYNLDTTDCILHIGIPRDKSIDEIIDTAFRLFSCTASTLRYGGSLKDHEKNVPNIVSTVINHIEYKGQG